jgi:acyl carrier protein
MDQNVISLNSHRDARIDEIILFLKRDVLIGRLEMECESPDEINADEPLFEQEGLGLDSIESLELMAALEGTYQVSFQGMKEEQLREALYSIRTLATFLDTLMSRESEQSEEASGLRMVGN